MERSSRGRSLKQKMMTLLIELSMLMILLALVAPQYLQDAFRYMSTLFEFLP